MSRASGGLVGSPISGLKVNVWRYLDANGSETWLGEWTTSAAGRINGDAGIELWARHNFGAAGGELTYSTRMLVEGPGYRAINMVFKMTTPLLEVDIPVDYLRPDFEEEGLST
jgi:hypothetical protein